MPKPRCCQRLPEHWPITEHFPALRLSSTQFEPRLLHLEDFQRFEIPEPRGIDKRKAEFLAGRFCAREALRQLTGLAYTPAVGTDRAPCWPAGIVGSISHGHHRAGAVVAHASQWRGLGLDIEQPLSLERADALAKEIFAPAERLRYQQLPDAQRALQASLTFSLKESLFKALYPLVGRHFYFQDAEYLALEQPGQARLRLLSSLSDDWPAQRELTGHFWLFEDYLLTLVAIPAH
jgi:enterobactin synthetase component D